MQSTQRGATDELQGCHDRLIRLPSLQAGTPVEAQVGVTAARPVDSKELSEEHCFLSVLQHKECDEHLSAVERTPKRAI